MNNTLKKTLLISFVCGLFHTTAHSMETIANLVGAAADSDTAAWLSEKTQDGIIFMAETTAKAAGKVVEVVNNINDERKIQIEAEFRRKITVQRNIINSYHSSNEEKERARKKIESLENEEQEQLDEIRKIGLDAAKKGTDLGFKALNMGIEEIQAHQSAVRDREKAVAKIRAKAEEDNKAMLEKFEKTLAFIKDKNNAALLVGIAAGIFGSYFILKHGIEHVSDAYRIPTLAQETSLIPYTKKFKNWVLDETVESDLTEVKLTEELANQMEESALGLKRMVANDSILQNKLFYGPPGTGKTEFAHRLARYSGMHYIYFSASALEKFSIEEATKKIAGLFTFAENSSEPLLIIADEAELVFADRSKLFSAGGSSTLNEKRIAINNQFLTYLSKGSKHYMVIAITNYPDQLDSAFLSRCDEKIFFDAPDADIRRQIFDLYVDKYLIHGKHLSLEKKGIFNSLLASLSITKPSKKVLIEEDTFSEEARAEIASNFDEWVGRDIEQFVTALETAARATDKCAINPTIIKKVLARKMAEREQLKKGSYFMQKPTTS